MASDQIGHLRIGVLLLCFRGNGALDVTTVEGNMISPREGVIIATTAGPEILWKLGFVVLEMSESYMTWDEEKYWLGASCGRERRGTDGVSRLDRGGERAQMKGVRDVLILQN
jgi:hypothetical protein